MKKLLFLMMVTALLAASSYGRTVSVTSMTRNSEGRPTATLQFSTGDAAVLYVAYGAVDRGSDFDAWDYRRPVATVAGDTTTYTYVFQQDMDGDCKVARFFILEDYDLPLSKRYDYIQTDGSQYVETQFTPSGRSAVEMRLSLNSVDSSVALCCARLDADNKDSFTAFYIAGSSGGWRFDYFGTGVGSNFKPLAVVDQVYTMRLEGSGLYLDGSCLSSRTPVDKSSGRSLLLFGAKYGDNPAAAQYKASVKLYSMKAWSNSTDVASIVLDLVPTEYDGEPCLYNKVDGTYLKSARSGYPLGHGAEVAVVRPEVLSSSGSLNMSGVWYVDCVNGNDANLGTSAALPKQTIRAATTSAISGDIIRVAPGTYGALEGSQTWPESSVIGSRVVIPAGVTLESTGGAKNTFIVGAASQTSVAEGWLAGVGPGAVRCVVAGDGATLRGFTLTGGYTHNIEATLAEDYRGGAFATTSYSRTATLEDCIVSNNVSRAYTINMAIVRRCRVIGNVAGPSTTVTSSGSAGFGCYWYGSIVAGNCGNATIYNALAFDNCTIGYDNVYDPAGHGAQVLRWDVDAARSIVNSAILDGRISYASGPSAKVCCTNCLVIDSSSFNADLRSWAYNTIITNSAAAQVDSEYRPILGQFAGIDRGGSEHSSAALGDKDILGTPRILNGALDIGAVEYDWRPAFGAELGRRFTVTYASPSVTTNTTGGLLVPDGAVAGTVASAGPYAIAFTSTGGSMAVYVGGVLAGECSGAGERSVRFAVADAADEIRFVYTPEAGSTAVLKKFSGARGFSVSFR